MADISETIQNVLNDPESVKQLQELAEMLFSGGLDGENSSETASNGEETGGLGDLFGGINMETLFKMQSLMGDSKNDPNSALLLAIKPYLSPEKQAKADKAVKLLRILTMILALKESGLLEDLV
jgi:hypothetical protein